MHLSSTNHLKSKYDESSFVDVYASQTCVRVNLYEIIEDGDMENGIRSSKTPSAFMQFNRARSMFHLRSLAISYGPYALLHRREIGGEYVSVKSAGNLSTLFDVGGIVGGILAGYISDKLRARAITATSFMYAAIPSMFLYRTYGSVSKTTNIVLMMIAGLFVNGPYALITTAVSADLGTHSSLRGDSRALATVTAIIDGTGSIGAALGPLFTGFLSTLGWDTVFIMLMVCALIAGLLLSRQVLAEVAEKTTKLRPSSSERQCHEAPASQPLLSDQR